MRPLSREHAATIVAPTLSGTAADAVAPVSVDVLYRRAEAGLPCWVGDPTGLRRALPVGRWLGGDASTPGDRAADEVLLRACTGPTLDLGCGPGRFTAALAARGVRTLGVDLAATAVAMTIRRGGMALHQDLFAPLPGFGSWAQVLLADGNIGIGGDPARVLRRARELLGVQGIVFAELDPPCTGVRREYLRLETEHAVGEWFPWARVGTDDAADLATAAGLRLLDITHVQGRFFTRMDRA